MWQMIGVLAELERSVISERTKAGRAAAMVRGVKMGRKPKLSTQQIAHIREILYQGKSARQIMEIFSISKATFYRLL